MRIYLTFLFTSLLFVAFSQDEIWLMEPDEIQSHGINIAHEYWTFFNQDGTPRDTKEMRTYYFDAEGKRKCLVEFNLDIVETRDSAVYFYDKKGREILRRTHIKINPRNLEIDSSWCDILDTLEERQIIYQRRKILRIDHRLDTVMSEVNRRGAIIEENTGNGIRRYFYKRRKLLMTRRIVSVYERDEKGRFTETYDTIITTYNGIGNPISTTGKSLNVEYSYEDDRLISKVEKKSENEDVRTTHYEYSYNQKGQLISMKRSRNNRINDWEEYEYDENGIRVKETSIHPGSGKTSLIVESTY